MMLRANVLNDHKFQFLGTLKMGAQKLSKVWIFLFLLGLIITQELPATSIQLSMGRTIDFFCSFALCPKTQIKIKVDTSITHYGYVHPDQKEILLSNQLDSNDVQLTLIHEFTHILRYEYNRQEVRWLYEGLAQFWEYRYSRSVWPRNYNIQFKQNPIFRLSEDEKFYGLNGEGYVSSFFLVAYLYKHFGGDQLMVKLMKSKFSGWQNILTSIHELVVAQVVSIPEEFIDKNFILRHLAVALWENDPYSAAYALFQLDSQYTPLGSKDNKPFNFPKMVARVSEKDQEDSLIQYSFKYNHRLQDKAEYYAITNDKPITIVNATDSPLNQIFFYITTTSKSP